MNESTPNETPPGSDGVPPSSVPWIIELFRIAQPKEFGALEAFQQRTALVSDDREQILAQPDAIEIPLQAVIDRCARVAMGGGRILGFTIDLPVADAADARRDHRVRHGHRLDDPSEPPFARDLNRESDPDKYFHSPVPFRRRVSHCRATGRFCPKKTN